MVDFADTAAAAEAVFRAAALRKARVRESLAPQERDAVGNVVCLDCGAVVPEARLRALPLATHCRECQEALEERRVRGR